MIEPCFWVCYGYLPNFDVIVINELRHMVAVDERIDVCSGYFLAVRRICVFRIY